MLFTQTSAFHLLVRDIVYSFARLSHTCDILPLVLCRCIIPFFHHFCSVLSLCIIFLLPLYSCVSVFSRMMHIYATTLLVHLHGPTYLLGLYVPAVMSHCFLVRALSYFIARCRSCTKNTAAATTEYLQLFPKYHVGFSGSFVSLCIIGFHTSLLCPPLSRYMHASSALHAAFSVCFVTRRIITVLLTWLAYPL